MKHTVLKTATGDGSKTTAQLLNELVPTLNSLSADVIEHTRIILNDNNMGLKYYFYPSHINKNANIYIFAHTNANTAASTPATQLSFLYLHSGSCKRVSDTLATTNSRSDESSSVLSSSWDFTLVIN